MIRPCFHTSAIVSMTIKCHSIVLNNVDPVTLVGTDCHGNYWRQGWKKYETCNRWYCNPRVIDIDSLYHQGLKIRSFHKFWQKTTRFITMQCCLGSFKNYFALCLNRSKYKCMHVVQVGELWCVYNTQVFCCCYRIFFFFSIKIFKWFLILMKQ